MLNILIPVYKGGSLFLGALNSALTKCPPSSRIFISFNGESDDDYARYLAYQKTIQLRNEVFVNRTNAELPAIQHAMNMKTWLGKHLSDRDKIMFLCHDDEILAEIPQESLPDVIEHEDCVTFPEWHLHDVSGNFIEIKKISEINLNQDIEDFIFDTFRAGDIYTNLSGIVCNFRSLKKYCRWLKIKKTGARMEFMLATASHVQKIRCENNIKVKIRKSPESDGSKITIKNYYYDEMNFIIWLLTNFRIVKYNNLKSSLYRFFELYKMYKISC